MNAITYSAVAAAAESIEKSGQKPSVRSIREHLGSGSLTTINPLLRKWREALAARSASSFQVNPAIDDLILAQIEKTAAQASKDASLRAKEAEDAFDQLAIQMTKVEDQLVARDEDLAAARAQLLQRQGQLQERAREIEELRTLSAAAIAEADQRAGRERDQAESLRQDLVRSNLRLEAVPRLEVALEDARRLLKASSDEVARARQSEAVAISRAEAQLERTREGASREAKLEAQLQRLQEEREKALGAERTTQQEVLRLSTMISSLEARCAVQQTELSKVWEARHNDSVDAPGDASFSPL